jgi:hypothetical protein
VTVHDETHSLVANATVNGTWSGAYTGTGSCTTDASGTCSITSGNASGTSTTFEVVGINHNSFTYDPGANHDPDGDSDGTSIAVSAP